LNGGAYNVLLNCTSKFIASIAACLTLVSYIATAVVSASSAVAYGQNLWSGLDPSWAVMALLGFFCLLTLFGLKESANVALFIFVLHIGTMSLLVIMCLFKIMQSYDSITMFKKNWQTPSLENVPIDIYYGFALALLGVSGFETSSNYIEEQNVGVFPKTLRNMWYVVSLFNPRKLLVYSIASVYKTASRGVSEYKAFRRNDVERRRTFSRRFGENHTYRGCECGAYVTPLH